ncbi:hypothetical protein BDY24DRAFT_402497, partial [Mrakia frigida]|uniref:uncharacterized protein n=1 Tax=Mrakia frigida TaxID=29902 RepID=UPI003FCC06EB
MSSLLPRSSSLPSSLPLPSLPIELNRSILSFVDTQTIGRCCRVSLAFLEIASELLYRDVEVEGIERLKDMFCTRDGNSSPTINAALSLHRIRTFTFLADAHQSLESLPPLSPHRHSLRPIELELLAITIATLSPEWEEVFEPGPLLAPFNPFHFFFSTPLNSEPNYLDLLRTARTKHWNRISTLRLINLGPCFYLQRELFASSRWSVAFELSRPFDTDGAPSQILGVIKEVLFGTLVGAEFSEEGLRSAEVVVQSGEEKTKVERFLREQPKLEPEELEERMKHILVAVRN